MKALLPDSILSRTVAILLVALGVMLAVALLMFSEQRSRALDSLGGWNATERIPSLVQLLEETPEEDRFDLLSQQETPGFRIGWDSVPLVSENDGDESSPELVTSLTRQLRDAMEDEDRLIRVSTRSPPRRFGLLSGPALRISVALEDESWLNVVVPLHRGDSLWRASFLLPLTAALLVIIGGTLWGAQRATRSFSRFARAAERLGMDVGAPPLAEAGPREVRLAARAFNVMQERIRRFVQDRTQMMAAVSHDLRTPLTRMKLRAEFVEDEQERTKMLADLDEMEAMIAAIMTFARDDAAREEHCLVDLAALVQGLAEDLGASYQGPESLVMALRPVTCKRVVANLVENALKYGDQARTKLLDHTDTVVLEIDDDGPGIPEASFETVFQPFTRLETSRNRATGGVGLGLWIARAGARAHGGDIALSNREDGGLRVTVFLPRRTEASPL